MRSIRPSRLLALITAATGAVMLSGCGSTGITAGPLDTSISRTFANLYVLQQVELGSPRPSLTTLATSATCRKGTPATAQSGAGNDWVCEITYFDTGLTTSVTAIYDLNVQTDGCYSADADGPASLNTPVGQEEIGAESSTLIGRDHRQFVNPLWLIDGCFDVT